MDLHTFNRYFFLDFSAFRSLRQEKMIKENSVSFCQTEAQKALNHIKNNPSTTTIIDPIQTGIGPKPIEMHDSGTERVWTVQGSGPFSTAESCQFLVSSARDAPNQAVRDGSRNLACNHLMPSNKSNHRGWDGAGWNCKALSETTSRDMTRTC